MLGEGSANASEDEENYFGDIDPGGSVRMRGRRLTERDTAVVVDVYKYRYLKAQIADLYFPSHQTANRRLRSLVDQGYVAFFTVPNIEERIYRITTAGAKLVAEVLGVATGHLLWSTLRR